MATPKRKRRKKRISRGGRRLRALLILTGIIVALVVTVRLVKTVFPPFGPAYTELRAPVGEVGGVPLYELLVPAGDKGRPGQKRVIRHIVIHETGNPAKSATARSHANFLASGGDGQSTSWHYTVDENEIYQQIPDNEVAFHAGDGRREGGGNEGGIGIEICVNDGADYEKALDNAAKLTGYLCKCYGLGPDDIKQHADFMSKNCPERLRDSGRWEEFKARATGYMA